MRLRKHNRTAVILSEAVPREAVPRKARHRAVEGSAV